MWFQANEGAKFWMQVLTDLKQRGVQDILICCVDGLKGFPEAIEAIFPQTTVQTCIVHLIRHSLKYVPAPAIRRGGQGPQADLHRDRRRPRAAGARGVRGEVGCAAAGDRPGVAISLGARDPFMAFEPEVRRVIYTTNAIEALNRQLRKAIKTKGSFPSEDAARKLIYLAIQNAVPAMDPDPRVDESAPRVQDPIRRPTARLTTPMRTLLVCRFEARAAPRRCTPHLRKIRPAPGGFSGDRALGATNRGIRRGRPDFPRFGGLRGSARGSGAGEQAHRACGPGYGRPGGGRT